MSEEKKETPITDEQKKERQADLDNRVVLIGKDLQESLKKHEASINLYISTANNQLTAQMGFVDRKEYK